MSKFDKTCRVCLGINNESKKCLSLFESYEESTVCAHISCMARVQIREGDGLPDRICPECLLQLGAALAFRRKCEASDKLLRGAALSQVPVEFKHEHDADDAPVKEEAEASDECDAEAECAAPSAARPSRSVDLQLVCDDCQGRFKTKCKLRVHWKKAHLADKLTCPDCKRLFHSYKSFNNHVRKKCRVSAVANIEGQGKSRMFYCKHCSFKQKSLVGFKTHLRIHTGEKPYQCKKCDKRFAQTSSLQGHMETHHQEYIVECPCYVCGKYVKGRKNLSSHMRRHKLGNVVKCDVCHITLRNKSSLQQHMKRHSGVKDYVCEECPVSFYTNAELLTHRKKKHLKHTHRYKCNMCEYSVNLREPFVKHIAKHTGTNVPCLTCGFFFDNVEKLKSHQKLHLENKYACPHCDNHYATAKSRRSHIRKKHKELITVNEQLIKEGKKVKEENKIDLL